MRATEPAKSCRGLGKSLFNVDEGTLQPRAGLNRWWPVLQTKAFETDTIWRRLSGPAKAVVAVGALGLLTACAPGPTQVGLNAERQALALREVSRMQSRGQRVWCVPYARNLSGIEIRGNAKTWWGKARGTYDRGSKPVVGSVMSFRGTRGMPLGHVAVVAGIVSEREIVVNHANWHRNKVSMKMGVKDVSKNNDWTLVRVESQPGQYGKFYPVNGFIYPNDGG